MYCLKTACCFQKDRRVRGSLWNTNFRDDFLSKMRAIAICEALILDLRGRALEFLLGGGNFCGFGFFGGIPAFCAHFGIDPVL